MSETHWHHNMFSHIQKRTRIILIASALAFLVAAGGYGGMMYMFFKKSGTVDAMPAQADALIRKTQEAQSARRLLAETITSREALTGFFFKEDDVVKFLEDLENVARETNSSLELKSAMVISGEGLSFQAETIGSWQSVALFVDLLESYPASIEITHVSFTKGGTTMEGSQSKENWTATVTFVLKSYIGS